MAYKLSKNGLSFHVDSTEFNRTLRAYMQHSKKDLADVLTAKAWFIARGATNTTKKITSEKIRWELGQIATGVSLVKRGKRAGTYRRNTNVYAKKDSFAERIIRASIAKRGGEQPTESEMEGRVAALIKFRVKSAAFVAACWLGAVRVLGPKVVLKRGAPKITARPSKGMATRIGGGGRAARPGWRPFSELWSNAPDLAKHKHSKEPATGKEKAAVTAVAEAGLRRAVADEVASMKRYIEQKLTKTARKYSAK